MYPNSPANFGRFGNRPFGPAFLEALEAFVIGIIQQEETAPVFVVFFGDDLKAAIGREPVAFHFLVRLVFTAKNNRVSGYPAVCVIDRHFIFRLIDHHFVW